MTSNQTKQFGKFISKNAADKMFNKFVQAENKTRVTLPKSVQSKKKGTLEIEHFFVFDKVLIEKLLTRLKEKEGALFFHQAYRNDNSGRKTLLVSAYQFNSKTKNYELVLNSKKRSGLFGQDILEHSGGGNDNSIITASKSQKKKVVFKVQPKINIENIKD